MSGGGAGLYRCGGASDSMNLDVIMALMSAVTSESVPTVKAIILLSSLSRLLSLIAFNNDYCL